jgi:DNA (cytosine-5)-methyltransferase 1
MSDERPTHLDLFSGIGGFALAARWAGFRTVAFCEIEEYPIRNCLNAFWPDTPVFNDIRKLDGKQFRGVDLLTGGFPCQPYSTAGKRRGSADDRALWPEMFRIIKESKPTWIIGENVAGFASMVEWDCILEVDGEGNAIGKVGDVVCRVGRFTATETLEALKSIGYEVIPFRIPACAVDAKHRRDRVWIVGYAGSEQNERNDSTGFQYIASRAGEAISDTESGRCGQEGQLRCDGPKKRITGGSEALADSTESRLHATREGGARTGRKAKLPGSFGVVSDASSQGLQGQRNVASGTESQFCDAGDVCRWPTEPELGRVAHGIPRRVDRLKGLGNAIVPQVAFEIIKEIRKLVK